MIAVGQRYRGVQVGLFGRPGATWTVIELLTGTDGVAYARLAAEGDTSRHKTLAVSVLDDPKHFGRVDR